MKNLPVFLLLSSLATTALTGCGANSISPISTAPVATLAPALAFPSTTVGSTSTALAATLSNTGNATLAISGISIGGTNPADFAITTGANACGTTLTAGASCSVYVTFTPASITSFSATLTVSDNASPATQSVALTGTGAAVPAPGASITPSSLTFSSAPMSTTPAQAVTLMNTGTAALTISSISLSGRNASNFAITTGANPCGTSLAAGASCSISITFTPTSVTPRIGPDFLATLTVSDNANPATQTVSLDGTGTGTLASLTPASIIFPSTTTGSTASAIAATLSNTGNAALNISGISIGGANPADFAITTGSNACGTTVAAGASCSIYVTFTPATPTTFSAVLTVTDNANPATQSIAISGTGTSATAFALLTPTSLTFSNQTMTISSQQTVTLSNTGGAALPLSGITITGANASNFAETNNCGPSLAPGISCSIAVTFSPNAVASFGATLTVAGTATDLPASVMLTGTGTAVPANTATTGQVLAGTIPIVGASVQMYAAGTTGNGSAPMALLASPLTTDANGIFNVPVGFSCLSPGAVVYFVAKGGQAGATGATISNSTLMTSTGSCGSLTNYPNIVVNELTTVASAYAFAQFLSPGAQLGATATNTSGITLAAATLANLVNVVTGNGPGTAFPATGTSPIAKLNSLANALNACLLSSGTGSSACSMLLSSMGSGTPPTTTLDAILTLVKNPAYNPTAIYNLTTASTAYSPALTAAPTDWTMFITYTGGGMNEPSALSIDSKGNVWVANYASTASYFTNTGNPVFPTGLTNKTLGNIYGGTVDQNDVMWLTNEPGSNNNGANSVSLYTNAGVPASGSPYTMGGLNFPISVAVDQTGVSWIVDYGNSHLTLLTNSGTPLSGTSGYNGVDSSGNVNFIFPVAVAVDSKRNGWVANQSSNTVTKVAPDGSSYISYKCCNGASGVAVDANDNVWVANYYGDSVGLVSSAGSILSGASGFTGGGVDHPQGIEVDGNGNVWVANYRAPGFSELAGVGSSLGVGTAISPSVGYGSDAGLLEAFALAIDASGNIWITNFGNNTLTEFVGLAAPVKTPLLGATRIP